MISNSESQISNFQENIDQDEINNARREQGQKNLGKLFEYDISEVNKSNLAKHKKKLYQLAIFADISRIQIHFHGLEKLRNRYAMLFRSIWNSEENYPVERELFDLLSTIQMQSNVSQRKYNIKLVG